MNESTKMLRENRNRKYRTFAAVLVFRFLKVYVIIVTVNRIISNTIFTEYVIIKEVRNILSIK
ncbi:hypothetical protein G4W71_11180 [Clostridium botulinum]|uniref:hypothetical protein n=1 Tax=Clostridium botulinum TaxID=1491 RepID=UPI00090A7C48|nr:hypothetical protein [Clostridium botulinum]APH18683.1 hypothetical protein NPD3_3134 [Clostridium botulinum]MBE1304584.1 hypothetical protein [Clostridium botulinum]NFV29453.1 hypothetical protein [Clostridium botulinum]NHL35176.1 hypothetical protein [Clostridium botulinum]